jgi:glucose/arabinose dehydrogenase
MRKRPVPTKTRRLRTAGLVVLSLLAGLLAAVGTTATPAAAATLPPGFVQTQIAHPLNRPTTMAFLPDGRLLVAQQDGRLRMIKDGALLAAPALTLTVDNRGERGLVGVAVDPSFGTNGFVYLYYTAQTPTTHNRISRFTMTGDSLSPGSELVLLDLDPLTSLDQHNGGDMAFAPDGTLLVAVGDNQDLNNAQSLDTVKGKVLRINRDGSIPVDNPFYGTATGINRAIWARGFRNPFTLDIQPGSGRVFVNDVGQDAWEEVNEGVAGGNYGWPATEGYTSDPSFQSPRFAYQHGSDEATGCAVTGGAFYNPQTATFPSEFVGKYLFMDFCSLWLHVLDPDTGEVSPFGAELAPGAVSLTLGPDGSLYYLSVSDTDSFGSVYRIAYTGSLAPSIGTEPTDRLVSVGHDTTFTVGASGNAPLTYQWSRNGSPIPGATAASYTTPALDMSDDGAAYQVLVSNSHGSATSRNAVVHMTTDQPPSATIDLPASDSLYSGGDTIAFSGSASDPEMGPLGGSSFTWQVDFGHHPPDSPNAHFHPVTAATTGSTSGSFSVPTEGHTETDVYYHITLTVTDAAGLTTTVIRDVLPRTVQLTLDSSPSGMLLQLDGRPVTAPYTFTSVVGMDRSVDAFSPQQVGGIVYDFQSWSDGLPRAHGVTPPAGGGTITAAFARAPRSGTLTADPNPIQDCDGSATGATALSWVTSGVTQVEVHVGSPSGATFAITPAGTETRTTGDWVREGTVFFLQDVTGNAPRTADNTLATVTIHLTTAGCGPPPAGSIAASPNPIVVCSGTTGVTQLSWTTSGTSRVEVHIGSPTGSTFAVTGTGSQTRTTGNWVSEGMVFYLQNTSDGLPLTAANTLATVVLHLSRAGCPTGTIAASPNPIVVCNGSGTGITSLSWSATNVTSVEVHIGAPDGSTFSKQGPQATTKSTGNWVADGMTFYLQNTSGGLPLTAANTLATVVVRHTTAGCQPSGTISASPNPVQVCAGTTGATTLTWNTTGAAAVEVHVGAPNGATFAATGGGQQSRQTGNWVTDGMTFYVQNRTGGLPLTSANTLATVSVRLTSAGCQPTGTIAAQPNPIVVCAGTTGATSLTWTTSGTSRVEVHVGSPNGSTFAVTGPGTQTRTTGNWVGNGMTFYLQDTSSGPASPANTLATVTVGHTTSGCS